MRRVDQHRRRTNQIEQAEQLFVFGGEIGDVHLEQGVVGQWGIECGVRPNIAFPYFAGDAPIGVKVENDRFVTRGDDVADGGGVVDQCETGVINAAVKSGMGPGYKRLSQPICFNTSHPRHNIYQMFKCTFLIHPIINVENI